MFPFPDFLILVSKHQGGLGRGGGGIEDTFDTLLLFYSFTALQKALVDLTMIRKSRGL